MENEIAPMPPVRKLYRSNAERKVAGVCGGLAEYFNVDPTLMRVVMVVLAVSGPGIILYPALWIVVPPAPAAPAAPPVGGGATPPVTGGWSSPVAGPPATDPEAGDQRS